MIEAKITKMYRNVSRLVLSLICACVLSVPAMAQQCTPFFEIIVTLKPPEFGFPSVWDTAYKRDYDKANIELDTVLYLEEGTALVAGRKRDIVSGQTIRIVFAELNRRGRELREVFYKPEYKEVPVKMIRDGEGYLVVSGFELRDYEVDLSDPHAPRKRIKLTWFDKDLKRLKEQVVKHDEYDYSAYGVIRSLEQDGFMLLAQAVSRKDEADNHSVLIEYSKDGSELWKRSYRVGIPNKIRSVKVVDDRSYIAVGRILTDDNIHSGWAMKLDKNGAILWQRTYRRGLSSELSDVIIKHPLDRSNTASQPNFIFSGKSIPVDGGGDAAWLMKTDTLGQPLWQRYFRLDDYSLSAKWLMNYEDGRVNMLVNAIKGQGEEGYNHIRMLSLSPRGVLLGDESYIEGGGVVATDFIEGPKMERIVTAVIDYSSAGYREGEEPIRIVGLQPKEEKKQDPEAFLEFSGGFSDVSEDEDAKVQEERFHHSKIEKGWILVAPALDAYTDPCQKRYQ